MKQFSFNNNEITAGIKFTKTINENLGSILRSENVDIKHISFIYCTDDFLSALNMKYLKHDTLTDVLTFTLSTINAPLEAEIYISVERVRENATIFKTDYQRELLRVMIHGILHLCGYNDTTLGEQDIIRKRENYYLDSFGFT